MVACGADITGSSARGTRIGTYVTARGAWSVSGSGTVSEDASSAGHIGAVKLTQSSGAQGVRIHLGQSLSSNVLRFEELEELELSVKLASGSASSLNIGLGTFSYSDFIFAQATIGGTWNLASRAASVDATPITGAVISGYQRLGIKQPILGQLDFYINQVLQGSITTHVPGATTCTFVAETYDTALTIDAIRLKTKTLSR